MTLGPILLGLSGPDKDDSQRDVVEVQDEKSSLNNDSTTDCSPSAWEKLPPHKDEGQVQLDVDRSFVYYPNRMISAIGFFTKCL